WGGGGGWLVRGRQAGALASDTVRRRPPTCHGARPGARHGDFFATLCGRARATASLVSDALSCGGGHRAGLRVGHERHRLRAVPWTAVAPSPPSLRLTARTFPVPSRDPSLRRRRDARPACGCRPTRR